MTIQHAKHDELYTIAAFLDNCWREAYSHILPQDYLQNLSTEKRHENFKKQYDSGSAQFLMMHENGELIGAAVYGESITEGYEKDGEITAVYLRKESIGKGYGHALFVIAENLLYSMGYTNLVLDVFAENESAIRFYLKHGYKKVDNRMINIGGTEYPILVLRKTETKTPFIRPLCTDDVPAAMDLVWRVFQEFESPDYSDEGIAEFKRFIELQSIAKKMSAGELRLWGAYERDAIVGVVAIKPPLHIALLFVDKKYHRRGIARSLFETLLYDHEVTAGHKRISVNSSPYAVEAYRHLGFIPTAEEQTVNGLRFIPMEYMIKT